MKDNYIKELYKKRLILLDPPLAVELIPLNEEPCLPTLPILPAPVGDNGPVDRDEEACEVNPRS